MAVTTANNINDGDIIKQRNGDLLYVHDIRRMQSGKTSHVESFVTFPIVTENRSISGSQPVPISMGQIQNRDNIKLPANAVISVSTNTLKELPVSEDNYFADRVGEASSQIITEVDASYREAGGYGQRLSDDDGVSIRGQDYSIITGPVADGVVLDGAEKIKPRNTPKKKKAQSLVRVPDIYLEDAHRLGIIDDGLYTTLTSNRGPDDVVTLRGALALAQRLDKSHLAKYVQGEAFDEVFSSENITGIDDDSILDINVVEAAQEITITEALDRSFLKDSFTVNVFTSQGDGEEPDPDDDRNAYTLDEAITSVALYPDYFEQYHRPNKPNLKLTQKQIARVIEDVKGAFNVLGKASKISEVAQAIEDSFASFSKQASRLLEQKVAFMAHDPAIEVEKRVEPALQAEKEKLRRERPSPPKL